MKFTTHLELHSQTTRLVEGASHGRRQPPQTGFSPSMTSCSRELRPRPLPKHPLQITTRTPKEPDFKFELLPLHSPLLRQSLLVSFPPLIDMLKFSGYPYLIRGQPEKNSASAGAGRASRAGDKPIRSGTGHGTATAFRARPGQGTRPNTQAALEGCNDARTGMPPGIPGGAMCVQRFDDSLNSAIHITYRISLRSSSMPEPRDPLLKVLTDLLITQTPIFRQEFHGSSAGTSPGPAGSPGSEQAGPAEATGKVNTGGEVRHQLRAAATPVMILPQVHLRKPCYDFYFL